MRELKIDVSIMKNAYETNPKFRAVFDLLLDRERGRQDTTLPRIRRVVQEDTGLALSRKEAEELMQLWQRAGCGRYSPAKSDKDVRFFWDVNIPSVMEKVTGRKSAMTLKAESKGKPKRAAGIIPAPVSRIRLPKLDDISTTKRRGSNEAASSQTQVSRTSPKVTTLREAPTQQLVRSAIKVKFAGFEIDLPADMTPQERKEAEEFIRNLKALTK